MNYDDEIDGKNKRLSDLLKTALKTDFLGYEQTKLISEKGVYFIFDEEDEIIYIGMTNRNGKIRLRELASDFRSHTFNQKLLKRHIEIKFKLKEEIKSLNSKCKKQLIADNLLSEEEFSECQKHINRIIKKTLRFKFFNTNEAEYLEQFSISILQPLLNGK